MKNRTKQEPSYLTLGSLPEDAEPPGIGSAQCGGKHGEATAETETWLEQVLAPTNWFKLHHKAEMKVKAL